MSLADLSTMWPYYNVVDHCASRFEGDADGDGDVDDDDLNILSAEWNSTSCGCSCGESMMAAGDSGARTQPLPESADVDGDGDVDEADLAALDAIIVGDGGDKPPAPTAENASVAAPTPTLADPAELAGPAGGLPRGDR